MLEIIASGVPVQHRLEDTSSETTKSDVSNPALQESNSDSDADADSNAILHSFYDSAPMMMGVVEVLEDDILHLSDNATTASFMGVTPGATHNRRASEIGMPATAIAEWLRHYQLCASKRSTVRFDYAHQTPQEVRWLSVTVSYICTAPEGRVRCSYIAEDVTEQKRSANLLKQQSEALSASEQRLRILIDHFPNGAVVLFDQDLRFIVAGGAALAEAGMPPHFLEGKTVWEAFDPEIAAINDPLMRLALTGSPSTREVVYGSHVYELRVVPIRNAEAVVVAGMTLTQDITAHKATEREQRFLAEATNLLTSSLDYQTTLQSVAQLVVPHLADWCVVHLFNEAGVLEQVTVAHTDPTKVGMARESSQRYPPNLDAPRGIATVLRSGRSDWIEEITDEMIRAVARDEEHYQMLATAGMRSYLCVPLLARGKTLGAITFIGAESGHRYTAASLSLAEELARHAAIAVENARLYAAAQREIEERQRAEVALAELNARLRRSVQETHHRVKNNLQIISALAELQMEDGEETVPVAAVKRIGQHTRSLAAIHDLLTHETKADAHADSISIKAALDKLVPLLQATTGGRRIRYQVTDFRLPVREGASLALLVSELVSNSVKHGRDTIDISLTVNGETACLEVCDNGPGFPPGFDWRKAANTGIGLIDSTGRHDLHGTIVYQNRTKDKGGACVTVTFPIP